MAQTSAAPQLSKSVTMDSSFLKDSLTVEKTNAFITAKIAELRASSSGSDNTNEDSDEDWSGEQVLALDGNKIPMDEDWHPKAIPAWGSDAEREDSESDDDEASLASGISRLPNVITDSGRDGIQGYHLTLDIDKELRVKTARGYGWYDRKALLRATAGSQPPASRSLSSNDAGHPVKPCDLTVVGGQARQTSALVEVKQSDVSGAGYGAFALESIKKDGIVFIEPALFHANDSTVFAEVEKLDAAHRAAFESLHAFHATADMPRTLALFRTNNFCTRRNMQGVFLEAARFNHACQPHNNVSYAYDEVRDCVIMTANDDIAKGDELFISYSWNPSAIFHVWGFECRCRRCSSRPRVRRRQGPIW